MKEMNDIMENTRLNVTPNIIRLYTTEDESWQKSESSSFVVYTEADAVPGIRYYLEISAEELQQETVETNEGVGSYRLKSLSSLSLKRLHQYLCRFYSSAESFCHFQLTFKDKDLSSANQEIAMQLTKTYSENEQNQIQYQLTESII